MKYLPDILGKRFIRIMLLVLAISIAMSNGPVGGQTVQNDHYNNDLLAMVNTIVNQGYVLPSEDLIAQTEATQLPEQIFIQPSLLPTESSSSDGPEPEITIGVNGVSLDFQNADILALINTVSSITGKNFIVDPRVKGRVTLISGSKLNADQVYAVFLSVLEVHNFAAIESDNLVKILPVNLAKQRPIRTSTESLINQTDEYITQVYSLKHVSAVQLTPMLRPLLPPTSHFAAHPESNTLVFTDSAANIERILQVLDKLDQPTDEAKLYVISIKHADAKKLAQILSQTANGAPVVPGMQNSFVSVQADEGLNSLIIQATEKDYLMMQALVDELDIPREDKSDIHVVYLNYAKAVDLAASISEVTSATTTEIQKEGAAPTIETTIKADEDANALIIRADEKNFAEIKFIIDQLDVRRSQVFVEAIIAEVSEIKEADIGVEWSTTKFNSAGEQITAATDFSDSSGGFTLGFLNRFIRDLSGNVVPDLELVLRLLRSDTNSNIISTPTLLTLDNETAEIVVGQEVPFVTGSFSNSNTDADGNLVNPFQTIERKDVGLTLKITPQISKDNTIRLEFEQEISRLTPTTVAGAADLITNKRSINGTVLADDGQIIVLGGLIAEDIGDTIEYVPGLGKIPILGALFRKKAKNVERRNLVIFLRPKIIRKPSDLFLETRNSYAKLQNEQIESLSDSRNLIPNSKVPVLPALDENNNTIKQDPFDVSINNSRITLSKKSWIQRLKQSAGHKSLLDDEESHSGRR